MATPVNSPGTAVDQGKRYGLAAKNRRASRSRHDGRELGLSLRRRDDERGCGDRQDETEQRDHDDELEQRDAAR